MMQAVEVIVTNLEFLAVIGIGQYSSECDSMAAVGQRVVMGGIDA
jgi:hypothetical protein